MNILDDSTIYSNEHIRLSSHFRNYIQFANKEMDTDDRGCVTLQCVRNCKQIMENLSASLSSTSCSKSARLSQGHQSTAILLKMK